MGTYLLTIIKFCLCYQTGTDSRVNIDPCLQLDSAIQNLTELLQEFTLGLKKEINRSAFPNFQKLFTWLNVLVYFIFGKRAKNRQSTILLYSVHSVVICDQPS